MVSAMAQARWDRYFQRREEERRREPAAGKYVPSKREIECCFRNVRSAGVAGKVSQCWR